MRRYKDERIILGGTRRVGSMEWHQQAFTLRPRGRGFHLITGEILRAGAGHRPLRVGMANIFIQHTSASLALNENADPTVRQDMEAYFNRLAPENAPYYAHTLEGPDDMPAHLKSVLLGSSLTLPDQQWSAQPGHVAGRSTCASTATMAGRVD